MTAGNDGACPRCGYAPRAGLVVRDKPEHTRGLEALSRHFKPRWLIGVSILMFAVTAIYFFDISAAERTGGSFSGDMFTIFMYETLGKWGVVGMWTLLGCLLLWAGIMALRREKR